MILCAVMTACSLKNSQKVSVESSSQNMDVMKILIGAYTGSGNNGICQVGFDPEQGTFAEMTLLVEATNPSFITISRDGEKIFAVSETRSGHVSSYVWNTDGTGLRLVNSQPTQGDDPCHLELNPQQDLLAVANYTSGSISVFNVSPSGEIKPSPKFFQLLGSGPVKPNQDSPRGHCVKFDANGQFLYAVDLGADKIISYPIRNGEVLDMVSSFALDPGDGPRHLIFDPTRDWAYLVNELSSTVVSLQIDHRTGVFKKLDKVSTLPADFAGKNYCADIHITKNGKYLFASNRGHHSIAVFSISETGQLVCIGIEPVQGEWPRNFTLTPDEKFILVANQNTDNITVFSLDRESGALAFTGSEMEVSKPVALVFR